MASPYLNDDQRLGDVIPSIQALGTYPYYKLDFKGWADRITGDGSDSEAAHWRKVFEQHPEFFRLGLGGKSRARPDGGAAGGRKI
jgi:hypothetical protein